MPGYATSPILKWTKLKNILKWISESRHFFILRSTSHDKVIENNTLCWHNFVLMAWVHVCAIASPLKILGQIWWNSITFLTLVIDHLFLLHRVWLCTAVRIIRIITYGDLDMILVRSGWFKDLIWKGHKNHNSFGLDERILVILYIFFCCTLSAVATQSARFHFIPMITYFDFWPQVT